MYALHGGLAFSGFGVTHCVLIPLITSCLPIMDEIVKRVVAFVQKCLLSDCELDSFVMRYAIWVGRMSSHLSAVADPWGQSGHAPPGGHGRIGYCHIVS